MDDELMMARFTSFYADPTDNPSGIVCLSKPISWILVEGYCSSCDGYHQHRDQVILDRLYTTNLKHNIELINTVIPASDKVTLSYEIPKEDEAYTYFSDFKPLYPPLWQQKRDEKKNPKG